ncbi:glycosyltransferase family A protein [Methylosinus sp.]|uniref:glycosyltransferase family 2 protein n=1 Tax=Methylosinus sp. TaxID=427 RepID=UPI002F92DF1C
MLENFSQFQKIENSDHKLRPRAEPRASGRELADFLPLVSVIITNYNYGRFLLEAVDSVFSQTYPHIECIIVDDASTDDSEAVLESIRRNKPNVDIILHEENFGQTTAFRTGLTASSGEYVVFLDADDLLLPTFVETHLFVHLSLRIAVGFTSSDMFQSRMAASSDRRGPPSANMSCQGADCARSTCVASTFPHVIFGRSNMRRSTISNPACTSWTRSARTTGSMRRPRAIVSDATL